MRLDRLIQNARIESRAAINEIMNRNGIPPYLMDGVLCEILADIRKIELDEFSVSSLQKRKEENNGDIHEQPSNDQVGDLR